MEPDVLIIGGGLIGLAAARRMHARGFYVELWDACAPGQESSWAAAGMLSATSAGLEPALRSLAQASADLYPGFLSALERETGISVGYQRSGTLWVLQKDGAFAGHDPDAIARLGKRIHSKYVTTIEPALHTNAPVLLVPDASVNNRLLIQALLASLNRPGVVIRREHTVRCLQRGENGRWVVTAGERQCVARQVINTAGAWAGTIAGPFPAPPVAPRKGQALRLQMEPGAIRHTIVAPDVYLVPREDGSIVVGATVELAGFDKTVSPEVVEQLRTKAIALVPRLARAPVIESWAGLRPSTPDGLPLLGNGGAPDYWVASGHFRDGILLAPITAHLLTDLAEGKPPSLPITAFEPGRFAADQNVGPAAQGGKLSPAF